jgi:small subunit ribosomal protein S15
MARMYSRRKGKSGSKKPYKKPSTWVRYKPKEIELLIVKLAKEEKTSSQIGLTLRDTYGIPDVRKIVGKKITKILEEKKLLGQLPEDLMALIKRDVSVRKHIERNFKDETAKRGLILTESKIKRLAKYYKRTGKLPEAWKYDPKRVRMYLE